MGHDVEHCTHAQYTTGMGHAASLPLDPVPAQRPLFGHEPTPAIDPNLAGRIRHALGQGAFVDRVPRWVHTGDARLFDELEARVRWRAETRRMYDRTCRRSKSGP